LNHSSNNLFRNTDSIRKDTSVSLYESVIESFTQPIHPKALIQSWLKNTTTLWC